MHDYDWQLLMDKLDRFEAQLKSLENDVFILNRYVDMQLPCKPKDVQISDIQKTWDEITNPRYIVGKVPCMYDNVDPNQAMGLVCSCPKHSAYALSTGNFQEAGLPQTWKLSTTKEDFEE